MICIRRSGGIYDASQRLARGEGSVGSNMLIVQKMFYNRTSRAGAVYAACFGGAVDPRMIVCQLEQNANEGEPLRGTSPGGAAR